MKKVTMAAIAVLTTLTACKKDYTCECVGKTNGVKTYEATIKTHEREKKAREICEAYNYSYEYELLGKPTKEEYKCVLK